MKRLPIPLFLAALVVAGACDDRSYSLGRPRQESSEGGEGGGASGVGGDLGGSSGAGGMSNGSSGGDVSLGGTGGNGEGGGEAGGGSSGDAGAGGDVVEPACGNSVTEPPQETCDDGNQMSGDGCSAACRAEPMQMSVGGFHACALSSDGALKCWGVNNEGQLGVGDRENRGDAPDEMGVELPEIDLGTGSHVAKLALGGLYSCAVLDQASVKCWGYNLGGELGQGDRERRGDQPGETGDNLPPIELGTERRVERLAAGQFQNCAVLDDGSVKCWGSHVSGIDETNGRGWAPGQMGDDLPVVNLGSRGVVDVTAGQAYACALVDDGSAKCWGTNNLGQLGVGDTLFRSGYQLGDGLPAVAFGTGRRATRVVAAYEHACALLEGGSVKCWGGNSNGQLGLGDTDNRGDGPGEMGDDLPPVELGDGRSATDIVGGYGHTCVLLDDGSVKCWGFNETGELGLGDTENRGDEPGEMGNELPPVNLGTGRRVTKLDAGLRHTCALLDDGSLKCWGFNGDGRLGLGDTEDRGDEPDEMGDNLPAVELGF